MRSGLPLGEAAAAPLRRVEAPRNASSRARAAKMSSLSSRMPPLPPAPAYDPSTTPAYDLHNVGSLTTYQLRQELELKGAFARFFPDDTGVCHDSLLAAMVSYLREEQAKAEAARFEALEAEAEARKQRMAEAKEARKAEALERSRLRREAAAKARAENPPGDAPKEPVVLPPPTGKVVMLDGPAPEKPEAPLVEEVAAPEPAGEPARVAEDTRYALPVPIEG